MKILIDSREPLDVQEAIKKYPAFAKCEFAVQELPAGDCWIDDKIIVERKTISDLLSSIADNRLFNQADAMRRLCENCYICLCGPLTWGYNKKIIGTEWHYRSVVGALLQVQELGVCVINAADDADYPSTLNWLAYRDLSKITVLWPRKYGIATTVHEHLLVSLPGIGEVNSEKLLKEFGGAIEALIALCDDDVKLPDGIGAKVRQNIKEAFGLSVGEKLTRIKK
jgi:ERCC4-type nuclease